MKCLKCFTPIDSNTAHYGLHSKCFHAWFSTHPPAEFLNLIRRSSASLSQKSDLSPKNASFFHGKFKKYSAELEEHSYILKMSETDAPELPKVEYLCNQIAKALEIPVAEFYLIKFQSELTFVTKNFINPKAPADLQHIHHFRKDEEHSCEDLIRIIFAKTNRSHDVRIFINTLLYDALIGNHDRHGRNLGLVRNASGISLSPIYDNVSYLALETGDMLKADFNPMGKITTKVTNEPSMREYVKELKRLGHYEQAREFYQKIKLPILVDLINTSFCSKFMKKAIIRLITKRYKEIEDEIAA